MNTTNITKDTTASIEVLKIENEMINRAIEFFEGAGVSFPKSRHEHVHGLAIYIDTSINQPVLITPFALALSPKGVMRLYLTLTRDEKSFAMKKGKARVQALIRILNDLVKEGYAKGSSLSHNIENGKYRMQSIEVLGIFSTIVENALTYSMDGDHLKRFGDVYKHLGGENGTRQFFKEVMLAVEASIPDLEETDRIIGYLPNIKCYTCKYCSTDESGIRTCRKLYTELSGNHYDRAPGKYYDVHQSRDSNALVSSVIDERIDSCNDYKMR